MLGAVLCSVLPALGATYSWTGRVQAEPWGATGQSISIDPNTGDVSISNFTNWGTTSAIPGTGDDVIFGTAVDSRTREVDLDGNRFVQSVTFDNASAYTLSMADTVDIVPVLTIEGGGLDVVQGSHAIHSNVLLSSEGTWDIEGTLALHGLVLMSDPVTKSGEGTLELHDRVIPAALDATPFATFLVTGGRIESTESLPLVSVDLGDSGTLAPLAADQDVTLGVVSGTGTVEMGAGTLTTDLSPGGDGSIGTMSFSNNLTLDGAYKCDYNNGGSDLLAVTGALDLSDAVLDLNQIARGVNRKVIATYTSLTGTFSNDVGGVIDGFIIEYGQTELAIRAVVPSQLHVDPGATGNGDGSSWQDAYTTLDAAMDEANYLYNSPDFSQQVWIKAGVYLPVGGATSSILPPSRVHLYGGFAGDEVELSERDVESHLTIFSGDLDRNDTDADGDGVIESPDDFGTTGVNSYSIVRVLAREDLVFDGIVFTAGKAGFLDAGSGQRGGAIWASAADFTVRNCLFVGNEAVTGGAIWAEQGAEVTMEACEFRANRASNGGGGLMALAATFLADGCRFYSNEGGAVSMLQNAPATRFVNCVFSGNQADQGSAFYNDSLYTELVSCVFSGNAPTSAVPESTSSVISVTQTTTMTNCTVAGNSHPTSVRVSSAGEMDLNNTIIWGNTGNGVRGRAARYTYNHTLIQGVDLTSKDADSFDGTLTANDPLFISAPDPATAPTLAGDLKLGTGSPCIDAGDSTLNAETFDVIGSARIDGTAIDLGAYELDRVIPVITLVGGDLELSSGIDTFEDPGFSALDGTLPAPVIVGGDTVDDQTPGVYVITYDAVDPSGLAAEQLTRTVRVFNEPPSILSITPNTTDPVDADGTLSYIVLFSEDVVNFDSITDLNLSVVAGDVTFSGVTFTPLSASRYQVDVIDPAGEGTLAFSIGLGNDVEDLLGAALLIDDAPTTQTAIHVVASRYYVSDDATGESDGSSWEDAFTTLQDALALTDSLDEVWVEAGVYRPSTSNASLPFKVNRGIDLFGGFAGTETSADERDPSSNLTILSGDIDQNDSDADGNGIAESADDVVGTNSQTVLEVSLASDVFIDGFVITAANGRRGIIVQNSSCTIRQCLISGNKNGHALTVDSADLSVSNCRFLGNHGDDGAAIYSALYGPITDRLVVFTNCLFAGNHAESEGSVAYTADDGSGLYEMRFVNCTFSGNITNDSLLLQNFGSFTLRNCIVWNNIGDQSYDSFTVENCLIDVDPFFESPIDPALAPTGAGDYRLRPVSRALNAGNNALNASQIDLDGNARVQFETIDQGAYESLLDVQKTLYVSADAPAGGNGQSWATAFTHLQDALDLSRADLGQEIWVAQGVYYPNRRDGSTSNSRFAIFVLKSGTQLLGGFAGSESSADERDPETNPTVLSGDIEGNDTDTDGNQIAESAEDVVGNNAYRVLRVDEASDALVDGLIVTAGGRGIWVTESTCTVHDCVMIGNSSGGMSLDTSNVTVLNCHFTGNEGYGAGVFAGNYSSTEATHRFINCLFSGNKASQGAAVATADDGINNFDMFFVNCTFSGNNATSQLFFKERGTITLKNSLIYNNLGGQTYTYITVKNCLIDQDPSFTTPIDPLLAPNSDGDYRLQGSSIALEAGTNAFNTSLTDLDGETRLQGDQIDLGAYEITIILPPGYAEWIAAHYPGETDESIIGLTADPNGDGVTNGLAFITGESASEKASDAHGVVSQDGDLSTITFTHLDVGAPLQPVIYVSTDMNTWEEASIDLIMDGITISNSTSAGRTVWSLTTDATVDSFFYKQSFDPVVVEID